MIVDYGGVGKGDEDGVEESWSDGSVISRLEEDRIIATTVALYVLVYGDDRR